MALPCSQDASRGQSLLGSVKCVSLDSVILGEGWSRGFQKEPYTFCVKDNGVFGVMGQDPLLGVTVESQHEQEASPKPSGRFACQPETPSRAQ